MNFGEWPRLAKRIVTTFGAAALLVAGPQAALAQAAPAPVASAAPAAATSTATAPAAAGEAKAAPEIPGYKPLGPDMIKGMPVPGGVNVQTQYSDIGKQATKLHDGLLWVMGLISLFVLVLLLVVIVRFNKRANPTPSKTTHNTTIEVVWTLVPVLILIGIAIPSIGLLAKQYETAPKDALTVKVTGYQWYWGYTYPDNGGFEVISNMMSDEDALAKGEPRHLAVDHRMVVPVGVPIRLQTTGADVIHSFAVPSLWFKLDAVPGRLNEKLLKIDEPGIYYGQCSELCGIKHGYMPIAVEAVPMAQFEAWVRGQPGGTVKGDAAPAPATPAPAAAAAPAAGAAPVAAAPQT